MRTLVTWLSFLILPAVGQEQKLNRLYPNRNKMHSYCEHTANRRWKLSGVIIICCLSFASLAQSSDTLTPEYKNVIRYNLSGAMLFGPSKYFVVGYERTFGRARSMSVNIGTIALPKLLDADAGEVYVDEDVKNTGFHFSADYRFYLPFENKHPAPHGLYMGPYASYNHFHRENSWASTNDPDLAITKTDFNVTTVGFQVGYQFIFWKRFALDLLMIGPGVAIYDYKTKIDGMLDEDIKQKIYDALGDLGKDRIPGLSEVIKSGEIEKDGRARTTSFGYRYIVHIGIAF
jgi:hypothetical protein